MEKKIICISDNVWDKYLSRGKMYPGGQCVNTCVYAGMNGVRAAYLGQFGDDEPAKLMQEVLAEKGIDYSHSRQYPGEDGFALVTLRDGDLPALGALGVPMVFDFSDRWTPSYLGQVCPHLQVACLSCSHLPREEMVSAMKRAASYGVPLVLGTRGEEGAWALCRGELLHCPAAPAERLADTMGAGDAFLAALLCALLEDPAAPPAAMEKAARFATQICGLEGAFGYGVAIMGRTELEEWEKA